MAGENLKIYPGEFNSRVIVLLLLSLMWRQVEGGCDYKPCAGGIPHTMCEYPESLDTSKPKCSKGKAGLTPEYRKAILDKHNALRQMVAQGKAPNQPKAANMMKLKWNKEVEEIAQRFVNSCPPSSGHDKCRDLLDGTSVGQNSAMNAYPVKNAKFPDAILEGVQMWYKEVKDFNPAGVDDFSTVPNFGQVGHYTQLVWADTHEVGCGYLEYDPEEHYQYYLMNCNYAKSGNLANQGTKIYEKGEPCSKCPEGTHCSKSFPGLCTAETDESSSGGGVASSAVRSSPLAVPVVLLGFRNLV